MSVAVAAGVYATDTAAPSLIAGDTVSTSCPFVTAALVGAAVFTVKADTAVVEVEDRARSNVTVTVAPSAVAVLTVGAAGVLLVASSVNAGTDLLFESCRGLVIGGVYATRTAAVRPTAALRRSESVEPLAEMLSMVRLSAPLVTENADLSGSGSVSSEPLNVTASVQPVTAADDARAGVVLVSVWKSNDGAWLAGVDVSRKGMFVCS